MGRSCLLGSYVSSKMFMSVILSDARRSAATRRESKNPEDLSFIHAASGSSHHTPSALRYDPKSWFFPNSAFFAAKLFLRHHTSLGRPKPRFA